mgnify:FL=1|jgi:hypothetical protein
MDAIEAVVALVKERDELLDVLEDYEEWFDSLVDKHVTLKVATGKHKYKFVNVVVTAFVPGEGWEAQDEETDAVYEIEFSDFVKGVACVTESGKN